VDVGLKDNTVVKDNNSSVVVMDNKMVRAKYGKLSDVEARFIFFLISQIKYTDTEFRTFRFSVGSLLKELNMPGKNYTYLFGVLDGMVKRTIAFPDGEKSFTIFPWFSMLSVKKGELIEICFNDKLKPYLLELRKNFTKAELNLIFHMKNHTRRIYLMCKQCLNMGGFDKDINALRTELELGNIYKQYKYLARDVLIPARDEINKLADLRCSFKPVRVGRAYSLLNFKVWPAPASNKAVEKSTVGKNTSAKNKQIAENNRKAEAERQEQSAKKMEDLERIWEEKCKALETKLIRKSDVWDRCLNTIDEALRGSVTFETWFVHTELFLDNHNTAYILLPNAFAADVMRCNYLGFITEVLTKNKVSFAGVKMVSSDIKNQIVEAVAASDGLTGEVAVAGEDSDQEPTVFDDGSEQTTLF